MFMNRLRRTKAAFITGVIVLSGIFGLGLISVAEADHHFIPMSKFFPKGKCSPMIPTFELMAASFTGGEITEYKIRNDRNEVIEVITAFINKDRDQWAIVGSRRARKVIFCLYASGVGKRAAERRALKLP